MSVEGASEIRRVVRPDSYCCILTGDKSFRRIHADMERVAIELTAAAVFDYVTTYFREIPMKLIHWSTPTPRQFPVRS